MSETQHPTPTSSDHAPNEKMATDIEKYERLRRLEAARTGAQFSQEISDSLIRSHDWGTLLSAAPLALGFVGSCQVVASSPVASGLKLKKPAGGFTHLRGARYESLQANLVFLADTGRKTFLETETRMDRLVMHSKYLFSETGATVTVPTDIVKVNRIVDALHDDANAKQTLPGCMSALQSTVGECEGHLQAIEASFEHWLDIAQELSQVATESEQDTINESHENQQNLQSQELRRTYAEKETQRREDAVKEAQRRMTLAEEAFKQASKNIPSAWDALGLAVVDGLSQSVFTIGSALVTAISPTKYVALGHSVLGALKAGIMGEKHDHTQYYHPKSVTDCPNNDDPALVHLDNIQSYLSLLSAITKDGMPSISQQNGTAPNDSPGTIRTFFLIIDQELPKDAAPGTFSYDGKQIIHAALEILDELITATAAQKELSSTPTAPLPRASWHRRIASLQARTASLIARKDSMAGLAAGAHAPRLQNNHNHNHHRASNAGPTNPSILRTQLDRASAAYASTAAALSAQRTAHDAAVARLHHNLSLINSIRASIGTLQASSLTLDAIIRILRASIAALAGLKAQITHLLRFFQGIAGMVEFAARGPCRDLLSTLSSATLQDGETTAAASLAGVTYPDFQKQLLLNTALMIRGYFGVVHEIARLYVRISREYIVPGVDLVDGLGLSQSQQGGGDDVTHQRTRQLQEYQRGAVHAIRALAEEKQRALLGRTEERVARVREAVGQLSIPLEEAEKQQRRLFEEVVAEREEAAAREAEEEWDFVDATARLLPGGLSPKDGNREMIEADEHRRSQQPQLSSSVDSISYTTNEKPERILSANEPMNNHFA
ncbi:hypothetical protein B0J12DRAFT_774786 [Macrophomina phaseolina]|uniref:Uncharacterized protein n=1 Tax=Macrophomina phaseolina TaxID=35725 RepID=A0ABQ8GLL6_9PEZI|nr:hypothetical protein B0J12DRAFT_774786 [Macrophomina phaseolina]